jgi:eukaryotic-like serine/threonine-protein kinase
MPLTPGTRLGPYEILAQIGAGGMGEVYSASDTRLHRTVAVKVSTAQFSERFEREARAVAALNHSHICQIYDVGPDYLVMEYIDGRPLKGPLPLDQALRYAGQICDALDAAHKKSITHRDLKPANILVTKAGVKLLDFGLAKVTPAVPAAENTMTLALTGEGQILGTLQYMSPEQLQGRDADARSDIFAFGLVLYEMLTGKRAFEGTSPASVIAAILERGAPSVAGVAPAALDRVLRRCLAKDPDDRWQSARDLKSALECAVEGEPAVEPGPKRGKWLPRAGWIAAALLLAALIALTSWRGRSPSSGELVRFNVYPPEGAVLSGTNRATVPVPQFAVSPDGRSIVFAAGYPGALPTLWIRSIDELTPRPLPGTEDAIGPFWSPDGLNLGFFADGKLKRIPAAGGRVQMVAEGIGDARGAVWSPGGTIFFGQGNDGVHSAPAAGGPVGPVTKLDAGRHEGAHRWPELLPNGDGLLFTIRTADAGQQGIWSGSLDGKTVKHLIGADSGVHYAPPGYLLWAEGPTLLGQTFHSDRLELRDQPFIIAEGVGRSTPGEAAVSVSSSAATLAYAGLIVQRGRLTWFDRSGNLLGALGPDGDYTDFRLSPDGKRLAASLVDPKNLYPDIWLTDLTRGGASRFTFGPTMNSSAIWSPDGSRLLFRGNRHGLIEFYQKSASMGGNEEMALSAKDQQATGTSAVNMIPSDWSPDGRYLVYTIPGLGSGFDLWLLPDPAATTASPKPIKFLGGASHEMHGAFSPDGHLVAYGSNESGTYQVYVQTFPLSDRKWPVSTSGGYEPRWRGDGREIYYLSADRKLMAVPVGPGPSFGVPKPLFQTRVPIGVDPFRTHYDVSGDGQRFLVNTQIGDPAPNPITVVLNWTAALKK